MHKIKHFDGITTQTKAAEILKNYELLTKLFIFFNFLHILNKQNKLHHTNPVIYTAAKLPIKAATTPKNAYN